MTLQNRVEGENIKRLYYKYRLKAYKIILDLVQEFGKIKLTENVYLPWLIYRIQVGNLPSDTELY